MDHLGPLIIPDETNANMNYILHITHTEEVRILCEVMGV